MTGTARTRDAVRRAESVIVGAFALSALAAAALAVVYATGGEPHAEGVLLGIAAASLALGLVTWAHRLLPAGDAVQARPSLAAPEAASDALAAELSGDAPDLAIPRRRLLVGGLVTALGAMGVAALFPIRSLGPAPGDALLRTPWRGGLRLVTENGTPVRADAVPSGGLVTAFPEGHPNSADGQIVLVRVPPERLRLPRGREGWAPDGLVAYSKVCTHAGCPVGLYEAQRHQLLCPCHQSAFDVLRGAPPVFGPAARALPQLPLEIDRDGVLRAQSDFREPVGPSFWNRR